MGTTNYYSVEGEIVAQRDASGRLDYLPDALGSVVAATDENGTVRSEARYRPYGLPLSLSGRRLSFGWVGAPGYNEAAGVPHAELSIRARIYSSTDGRWITVDPLWPQELAYAYVVTNPATFIDPSGLSCDLTRSDLSVSLKTWPVCKADCYRSINPCTWALGGCHFDLNSLMELDFSFKSCSNCRVYQWASQNHGPWERDDAEGWPYRLECNRRGSKTHCNMNDNPGDEHVMYPCEQTYSRTLELITCVCCDGFSACFKWGIYHTADGCKAFCDHWGPAWLSKAESGRRCGLGATK